MSVCLSVRLHAYWISRTNRRIWIKLAIANVKRKLSSHTNRNLYRPIKNLSSCFCEEFGPNFLRLYQKLPIKNTINLYIIPNLEPRRVIDAVSRLRIGVFCRIVTAIRDFCHIPSDTKAHTASFAMRFLDTYPDVK
jgi:hypothetical protein